MFLKSVNPGIKIIAADPPGSVLYNYFKNGQLERTGDGSITEGIGQGRITANVEGAPIDDAVHVPDEESINMVRGARCVGMTVPVKGQHV
eukprot:m.309446 g.309446  ORF g.309446 m.309446 type:complete len:90 (+) comp15945_c10_seq3:224-493(+)